MTDVTKVAERLNPAVREKFVSFASSSHLDKYEGPKLREGMVTDVSASVDAIACLDDAIAPVAVGKWCGLYMPQCYPDEMDQPFPERGELGIFLNWLILEQDRLLEIPTDTSDMMLSHLAFATISKPKAKEGLETLAGVYQRHEELLLSLPEDVVAKTANLIGREYSNFGVNETGDLSAIYVVREVKDNTAMLPLVVSNLLQMSYVTSWRQVADFYRANVKVYKQIVTALRDSGYEDAEKVAFLEAKGAMHKVESSLGLAINYNELGLSEEYAKRVIGVLSEGRLSSTDAIIHSRQQHVIDGQLRSAAEELGADLGTVRNLIAAQEEMKRGPGVN